MKGTFYVIGAGTGDPKLLTIKGAELLKKCPVWFIPSAKKNSGKSTAFDIASAIVPAEGKKIINHYFPMKKVHRGKGAGKEVQEAWQAGAREVLEHLERGEDVAMPTLGDPAIYSTALYICETLAAFGTPFPLEIIPGVSSISAAAAEAKLPLCLGDERLAVIPATFANHTIKELLAQTEAAVFMKVGGVLERVIPLLEEIGAIENAVLVECATLPEQRVWYDIRQAQKEELHYFSTLVVRTPVAGRTLAGEKAQSGRTTAYRGV